MHLVWFQRLDVEDYLCNCLIFEQLFDGHVMNFNFNIISLVFGVCRLFVS